MENEFVSYEIALALKELGFDEPCLFAYYGKSDISNFKESDHVLCGDRHNTSFQKDGRVSAPLYQQVFRWFREKYKLHSKIEIQDVELDWYFYEILEVKNGRYNNDLHEDMNFKSYEEAEIACLRKLIEIKS